MEKISASRIVIAIFLLAFLLRLPEFFSSLAYDEIWTLSNFAPLKIRQLLFDLELPNNHPLNSILIKFIASFDPPVEFIRLPNLLANLVFTEQGTVQNALDEIEALRDKCRYLIVVTISGLDETAYDGETADYIRSMEQLNEHLLSMADAAVELVNGKPVMRKGDPYDLL